MIAAGVGLLARLRWVRNPMLLALFGTGCALVAMHGVVAGNLRSEITAWGFSQ